MSPAQYEIIIEGMRNPKNSWDRSDSYTTHICDEDTMETSDFAWFMGDNDHKLAESLAECLVALTGKHHGESEDAQELGLRIVSYIRDYCDKKSKELCMNVTCLATPAESLAGRLLRADKKEFGVIEGVTDREYYTNSFHIPVYYHLPAIKKIDIEAPYHALTNAGHISYVELDGDPTKNLAAFERIVRHMKEAGIGYGSINHPVDRDPVCGFNGIVNDTCPQCGRTEKDGSPFERIRRITGYLVGTLDKWNDAKRAEERDRVKHTVNQDFGNNS